MGVIGVANGKKTNATGSNRREYITDEYTARPCDDCGSYDFHEYTCKKHPAYTRGRIDGLLEAANTVSKGFDRTFGGSVITLCEALREQAERLKGESK